MDWRLIASITAGGIGFIALLATAAFSIARFAPDPVSAVPTGPPLLLANRADVGGPAVPEPRLSDLARRLEAQPSPPVADPTPDNTGDRQVGSLEPVRAVAGPARPPDPVPRPEPQEVVNKHLQRPKPAIEPAPRVVIGALPSAEEAHEPPRAWRPAIAPRPAADPRFAGVLTPAEILRMKRALRLTPDQEGYWPPVEAMLHEIGARQIALVRAGRKSSEAFDDSVSMRLYWAANPLLGRLREEQKAEIRRRARSMGFESAAAML